MHSAGLDRFYSSLVAYHAAITARLALTSLTGADQLAPGTFFFVSDLTEPTWEILALRRLK